jgi:glycosyltransferase 2 family protein
LTLVKLVVAGALIWWILRGTSLGDVKATLGSANLWLLAAALGVKCVGVLFSVTRWRLLLGSQGVLASIPRLYRSFLVGMFFNNFLPSNIGGDTYRSYDNWRMGAPRASAVVVIFMDRFLGLVTMLAFASLALLWAAPVAEALPVSQVWPVTFVLCGVALAGWGFGSSSWAKSAARVLGWFLPGRARRLVRELANALLSFRGKKRVLAGALGVSLLVQVATIFAYYVVALALDLPIGVAHFFFIVPVAVVTMMLPISINAIGVRENVFAFLLALYGVALPTAVAFAWLAFSLDALQGLAGGVIYASRGETSRQGPKRPAAARQD